jgi:hypothetical protein
MKSQPAWTVRRNIARANKMTATNARITRLVNETRSTPKVSAASPDPPPVSADKTKYIDRKVRITKTMNQTGSTVVTVADVKGQSSSAPFKCLKVEGWVAGASSATFQLGSSVWINDNVSIKYNDTSPVTRLCGVKINIPDVLAEQMNDGALEVLSAVPLGIFNANSLVLTVDVLVRYQI